MTAWVRGKVLSHSLKISRLSLWKLVGCAIVFCLGGQRQAIATDLTTDQTNSVKTQIQIIAPPDLKLPLPSLGEPELYLPQVPINQNIHLVLKLSERRVYVYEGDNLLVSYQVAVGKDGWETPTGNFQVIDMIVDPAWQSPFTGEVEAPGPDGSLGLRWIAFWTNGKDFIGFHGTPSLNSLGHAASHGCVRMRNEDVVALFDKVRLGTPVKVEP